MIALLWALGCGGKPAAAPKSAPPAPSAAPSDGIATRKGLYRLKWTPRPAPLPLNTLFEVEVEVADAQGAPVEDAVVRVDARMPEHGHGMATKPEPEAGICAPGPDGTQLCRHPGGRYLTRGMKFHMPGSWVLSFDVSGPAGSDQAEVGFLL